MKISVNKRQDITNWLNLLLQILMTVSIMWFSLQFYKHRRIIELQQEIIKLQDENLKRYRDYSIEL